MAISPEYESGIKRPVASPQSGLRSQAICIMLDGWSSPASPRLQTKLPKLSVVTAFYLDDAGELQTVFGPPEQQSEEKVHLMAQDVALRDRAGVSPWSRTADVANGKCGDPVLFKQGDAPGMK